MKTETFNRRARQLKLPIFVKPTANGVELHVQDLVRATSYKICEAPALDFDWFMDINTASDGQRITLEQLRNIPKESKKLEAFLATCFHLEIIDANLTLLAKGEHRHASPEVMHTPEPFIEGETSDGE